MRRISALVIISLWFLSMHAQLTQSGKLTRSQLKKRLLTLREQKLIKSNWTINPLDIDFREEEEYKKLSSSKEQQNYTKKRRYEILNSCVEPIDRYLKIIAEERKRQENVGRFKQEKGHLEAQKEALEGGKNERKKKAINKKKLRRMEIAIKNLGDLISTNDKALIPQPIVDYEESFEKIKAFIGMYSGWKMLGDTVEVHLKKFPFEYSHWFDGLLKTNDLDEKMLELMAFLYSVFVTFKEPLKEGLERDLRCIEGKKQKFDDEHKTATLSEDHAKEKTELQHDLDVKSRVVNYEYSHFYSYYARCIGITCLKRAQHRASLMARLLASIPLIKKKGPFTVKQDGQEVVLVTARQIDDKLRNTFEHKMRKERRDVKRRVSSALDSVRYWIFKSRMICPQLQTQEYEADYEQLEKQLEEPTSMLISLIDEDVDIAIRILTRMEESFNGTFFSSDGGTWREVKEIDKESVSKLQKDMIILSEIADDMLDNATLLQDYYPEKGLEILKGAYDKTLRLRNEMQGALDKFSSKEPKKSSRSLGELSKKDPATVSMGSLLKGETKNALRKKLEEILMSESEQEQEPGLHRKRRRGNVSAQAGSTIEEIMGIKELKKRLYKTIEKEKVEEKKKKAEKKLKAKEQGQEQEETSSSGSGESDPKTTSRSFQRSEKELPNEEDLFSALLDPDSSEGDAKED